MWPPVYLHIIKMDIETKISGQKPVLTVKVLISQQLVLATMFYFEQGFVFCRLINKNVLEWFLLIIICKEHTLSTYTNLLCRNHPTLCFLIKREDRQMFNTYQLLSKQNFTHNLVHMPSLN